MNCRYILGCRMTIKLVEEPNTIKLQASALCFVVIFKRRIHLLYVVLFKSVQVLINLYFHMYV
ncbi:hypothetical protein Hanom_Chr13g01232201 [Helianthus anomalus]